MHTTNFQGGDNETTTLEATDASRALIELIYDVPK